jgi:hypothetical protein
MARPAASGGGGIPLFLYGGGFGWNYGYYSYDPFNYYYGNGRWIWGRYGLWYDPYAYYPYDPYSYSSGYYAQPYREEPMESPRREVGSLRLKASPKTANVYVDGTLMGTVDDFDGFSHHLEVDLGTHRLELRADGYQTQATDVIVKTGTTTVRLTLKKK